MTPEVPEYSKPLTITVSTELPNKAQKWGSVIDVPGSYFGVTGYVRGRLAVGLLVPLGVLANTEYVQGKHEERASNAPDLSRIDLAKLLRDVLPEANKAAQPSPGAFFITPSGRLFFLNDNEYSVSCTLNVEYLQAEGKSWKIFYEVNMDSVYSNADPLSSQPNEKMMAACLRQASELFKEHVSGTLGVPVKRSVQLPDINLKMPVYLSKLPARVIANIGIGIQELRRSTVSVVE